MFQIKLVEKTNTLTLCSTTFFVSDIRAVYGTMWKNTVEPDNPQMSIHMHCKLDN